MKNILTIIVLGLIMPAALASCGGGDTQHGQNLIKNGGFEQVEDGLPKHWKIKNFRGLGGTKEATYRVNERQVYEGVNSFNFVAEEDTKRFYMLSQEIEVKGAHTIRVRAMVKAVGVKGFEDQYPQAGVALTFYNEFRGRFNSQRFADVRTEPLVGTSDGFVLMEHTYRLPEEIAYVEVHCVLGMSGRIWFDNIEVDLPEGLPWNEIQGDHFTHYWLDERPYPDGSREYQEQLYIRYAERLGIPPQDRLPVSYYLYPDTASIREIAGINSHIKVDYPRREIHSINPADDHEIVHLLTDAYGALPLALAEGTAFYLIDDLWGKPVQPLAQEVLRSGRMPTLQALIDPAALSTLDPHITAPAAASFIGYLLEFGSTERFLALHEQCTAHMSYDAFKQSFEKAYGPLDEAERAWHAKLASANFSEAPQ